MGLFIRDQGPRSELQSKIAAELQDRLKERDPIKAEKTEPAFTDNTSTTRKAGLILGALLVVGIIILAVAVS